MALVDPVNASGATPVPNVTAGNTQVVDAALADWIYHRAEHDQGLGLAEIEGGASIYRGIDVAAAKALGLTISPDGFIYNYKTGFCAAIVQDAAGYAVVFRGTDLGEGDGKELSGAAWGFGSPNNPDLDIYDVQQDVALGHGTLSTSTQAQDALNLIGLLNASKMDAAPVRVVGESLGGGLAGLVAAVTGLPATVIDPAPFAAEIQCLALLRAFGDATHHDPAEIINNLGSGLFDFASGSLSVTLDQAITYVRNTYSSAVFNDFTDKYNTYTSNFITNEQKISAYVVKGEVLSNYSSILSAAGATPFAVMATQLDVGPASAGTLRDRFTGIDVADAKHSSTLAALAIGTIGAVEKVHDSKTNSTVLTAVDFSTLLREDSILRDAFFGSTTGVVGPVSNAAGRSDQVVTDPGLPLTSKVNGGAIDPDIVERALWKTAFNPMGLYAYFAAAFNSVSGTLETGAAGGADESNVDPTIPTVHSGIERLALSVLRDAVAGTSTIDDLNAKPSHNFIGGSDGQPPAGQAVVHLSDITGTAPKQNDLNGLPSGENDLDQVVWNKLKSALGSDAAVASVVGRSLDQVMGASVAAIGLGWQVAVVQGGTGGLKYDAWTPSSSTGARTGDSSLGHLFIGYDSPDNLFGSTQKDFVFEQGLNGSLLDGAIVTDGGDDVIYADGRYVVNGGVGNDTEIEATTSSDYFVLSPGTDTIYNGAPNARLVLLINRIDASAPGSNDYSGGLVLSGGINGSLIGQTGGVYYDTYDTTQFENNTSTSYNFDVSYTLNGSDLVVNYSAQAGLGGTTTVKNFHNGDFGLTFADSGLVYGSRDQNYYYQSNDSMISFGYLQDGSPIRVDDYSHDYNPTTGSGSGGGTGTGTGTGGGTGSGGGQSGNLTNGGTGTTLATPSEAPVNLFASVNLVGADPNASETVTVTVQGAGGILTDGVGFAALQATGTAGVYTLSGTGASVTSEVDALMFTPTAGAPNTSSSSNITLTQTGGVGVSAASTTVTVVDVDPAAAPTITGTVALQATTAEASVRPFASATVADVNSGSTETLYIHVNGSGGLADGAGYSGLVASSAGASSYKLSGTAAAVTQELRAIVFTPAVGSPGTSSTTSFALVDNTSLGSYASDGATSVIDTDGALPGSVAPTITGSAATLSTTSEAPVKPFSGLTVSDANANSTEALTITVGGTGGVLQDGAGFSGLKATGTLGVYTMSGTATAVTSELAALVFTPTAGAQNTTSTATLQVTDKTSVGTAVTSAATVVTNTDPLAITIAGTLAGQTTTSEAPIRLFSGATITSPDTGSAVSASFIMTGGGTLADGVGYTGLRQTLPNEYELDGTAAAVTQEMRALVFTSFQKPTNTRSTTSFEIFAETFVAGQKYDADDTRTSVVDTNPGVPGINGGVTNLTTTFEAPVKPFPNVVILDANTGVSGSVGLTITVGGAGGSLTDGAGYAGLTASGNPGSYTLSGTAGAVTSELEALVFTSIAGALNTTRTATLQITDTTLPGTSASTATMTVVDSDPAVAPAIAGTVANQATTSDAPLKPFTGVTIADANAGSTETTYITLSAYNGVGTLVDGAGYSGLKTTSNAGQYVLSGTAAAVTQELRAAVFTPSRVGPGTISTITFTLYDTTTAGPSSTDATTTVVDTVPAVFPTITGTVANQATLSEAPIKPFSGVKIVDGNWQAADALTITVGGAGGTLSDGAGFNGLRSAGNGVYNLYGSAAYITSELVALSFKPTAGPPSSTSTTTFKLTDGSNAATGWIYATDTKTSVVDTDPAVAPAPTITGTVAAQATTSEAAIKPFSAVKIADANAGATETLTITVGGTGGTLTDGSGFTGLKSAGAGVYTLSGTAAAVTLELAALSFKPTAGSPNTTSTATFKLSDASSAGTSATDTTTTVVDRDPAVAPTITGTVAAQATTSEAAVKPFSAVKIVDANAGATETLTITVGGTGGTLTDGSGFTGLNSAGAGVYTVSGTAAAVTSELAAVSFKPTAGAPNSTSTTTFKLADASSAGTSVSDTITTVLDKDPAVAPTITGTVASQATTSEAAVKPFSAVTIADANAGATETLTITVGGTGGALTDGTGFTGLKSAGAGVYTVAGTAGVVTTELAALSFKPTAGASNTTSTTTFKLVDASSAGPSATDATTTVINKDPAAAPTITGTVANQATTSEAAVKPFSGVKIADSTTGATETVTITVGGTGGTLTDGTGFTGLKSAGAGVYTVTGTAAAVTSELAALSFKPTAGAPNSTSTTTLKLSDASSSGASASDTTTTVLDKDPAVAPTITGTVASQATKSEVPVRLFAGVTIADANANGTETLTIKGAGSGGALVDGAGYSGLKTTSTAGVYTLSGTAAALTKELDALVFTPTVGAAGTNTTTTFTLTDASSAGTNATDTKTSVVDTDPTASQTIVVAAGKTYSDSATGSYISAGQGSTIAINGSNTLLTTSSSTINFGANHSATIKGTGNTISFAGGDASTISGNTNTLKITGSETLSLFGTAEAFVFQPTPSTSTIAGFDTTDTVQFSKSTFADWAHLLTAASQVGSDTVIHTDTTNTVTLKQFAVSSLSQSQFKFV